MNVLHMYQVRRERLQKIRETRLMSVLPYAGKYKPGMPHRLGTVGLSLNEEMLKGIWKRGHQM